MQKMFRGSNATFNEASYVDLNWLNFEKDCEKKMIKFYFKKR